VQLVVNSRKEHRFLKSLITWYFNDIQPLFSNYLNSNIFLAEEKKIINVKIKYQLLKESISLFPRHYNTCYCFHLTNLFIYFRKYQSMFCTLMAVPDGKSEEKDNIQSVRKSGEALCFVTLRSTRSSFTGSGNGSLIFSTWPVTRAWMVLYVKRQTVQRIRAV